MTADIHMRTIAFQTHFTVHCSPLETLLCKPSWTNATFMVQHVTDSPERSMEIVLNFPRLDNFDQFCFQYRESPACITKAQASGTGSMVADTGETTPEKSLPQRNTYAFGIANGPRRVPLTFSLPQPDSVYLHRNAGEITLHKNGTAVVRHWHMLRGLCLARCFLSVFMEEFVNPKTSAQTYINLCRNLKS
ncbi:hypothetical protein CSKR_111288 [Clonorchis sinensis]|uniref:Uncharacterized protein n=1 Tax=Clonorchis sinensis TaxID=79923 RepID=A0A3R7ELE2_CLOSI|nr:hypothetical protein CSKR_111288 [Clonorchis sinensis]